MTRKGTVYQQLEATEAELKELREIRLLEPFYEDLGRQVMIVAQTKPFEEWPELLKIGFQYVSRAYPTVAQLAKDRLPK